MQRVDSSRFLTCLRIAGPMFSFFSLKYTVPYIVREVGASVNDTGPAFLRAFSREEDAFKSNETRVRSTCSCTRLASSWHSNVMKPYLGAPPKKSRCFDRLARFAFFSSAFLPFRYSFSIGDDLRVAHSAKHLEVCLQFELCCLYNHQKQCQTLGKHVRRATLCASAPSPPVY